MHEEIEGENDRDVENDGLVTPVGDVIDGSSSEFDAERFRLAAHAGRSMPATPPRILRKPKRKGGQSQDGGDPASSSSNADATTRSGNEKSSSSSHPLYKLTHSRSTPSLRLTIPIAPDSRVLRLRTLATKLRLLFVEDAKSLSSVLQSDTPDVNDFIDPRGRPPEPGDVPIHVFIDQCVL
jgi:hypothetical protein